jgi:hypothetical protein
MQLFKLRILDGAVPNEAEQARIRLFFSFKREAQALIGTISHWQSLVQGCFMQVVKKHRVSSMASHLLIVSLASWAMLNITAVSAQSFWTPSAQSKSASSSGSAKIAAAKGNYQSLDSETLQERFEDKTSTITIDIPLPDGSEAEFRLTPSNVMSAALAKRYPEFMTYEAVQVDEPKNVGRFSLTHKGLSGIFLQQDQWALLSPLYEDNDEQYISYYYKDSEGESLLPDGIDDSLVAIASSDDDASSDSDPTLSTAEKTTGDTLTTYRLVLSATGEYTEAVGGTKADAVAEMVSLVSRVNQILLVDTAIQFELVDNEDVIYTDADSDPYTNSDSLDDLEINQEVIDDAVGSDNYDIGHLLATNPGGLAYVGVVCLDSYKAQGYSGNTSPEGERFYIDLVAHELGHQLNAEHSFNAEDLDSCTEDQRSGTSAYEPGSGSTIMSYAGICSGQNLQNISDPYYHAGSVELIREYVESGRGSLCGTTTSLSNTAPTLTLSQDSYSIPANTPFVLDVDATDEDDDELTYTWEQMDAGGDSGGTSDATEMSSDNGFNPLFRSYEAVSDSYRYFPALDDVLNDTTSFGETYATTDRELNFRVTAKDNLGGVNTADVLLDVTDTGEAFAVTLPTSSSSWVGNTEQSITWNTASTQNTPINCSYVDITADLDGDNVFDTTLSSETDNDGEATVFAPNTNTSSARVKVSCSDNVFFAVNPAAFTISEGSESVAPIITGQSSLTLDEDTSITVTLDDLEVSDSDSSYPDNFTLTLQDGSNYIIDDATVTPDADFNGELSVSATVNDGINDSNSYPLVITVNAVNDAPVIDGQSDLTIDAGQDITLTLDDLEVTDPDSTYPDDFTLSVATGSNYTLEGAATITADDDFSGEMSVSVSVNDGTDDSNSYSFTITVNSVNTDPVANNDSETVEQDSSATLIDVLSNDSDADDDALSLTSFSYTGDSTVSISNDQIRYQPEAGLFGTETLSYTISDGTSTDTATLTITINQTTSSTSTTSSTDADSSSSGGTVSYLWLILLSMTIYVRNRRRDHRA